MAQKWTSVNLPKKFVEEVIEKHIEDRAEWSSPKEFIKDAVREKIKRDENQETQQLLNVLDKILKNSELTREEVQKIIKKEN